MAIYNISYDLRNKDTTDYSRLYEAITSYDDWCHPLESTWLVCTKNSADEIFNRLKPFVHDNDRLLVMLSVVPGCKGHLDVEVIDWLRSHNHF